MLTDKPQVGDTVYLLKYEDCESYAVKEARLISVGPDLVCIGIPFTIHGPLSAVSNYSIAFVPREDLHDNFMAALDAGEKEKGIR